MPATTVFASCSSRGPKVRTRLHSSGCNKRGMTLSRRELLQYAVAWGVGGTLRLGAQDSGKSPLFLEVPAATSGIHFIHDNAMSENHYLPETLGSGCAFLDYDND